MIMNSVSSCSPTHSSYDSVSGSFSKQYLASFPHRSLNSSTISFANFIRIMSKNVIGALLLLCTRARRVALG